MNFLFYLLLLAFPIGRVLNQPLWESERKTVPLDLMNVVVALLVGAWLVHHCLSRHSTPLRKYPNFKYFFLFVLWAGGSLAYNAFRFGLDISEIAVSGLYLVRWIEYALLYYIVYDLATDRTSVNRILKWVFAGGVAFCCFGFFQAAFLPDFALWLYPEARAYIDYDPQGHRLVSTILDPNIAAGYIIVLALIALSFYIHGMKRWLPVLIIFLTALVLTLSRGGALGFAAGVASLLVARKVSYKKILVCFVVLALITIVLYPLLEADLKYADRLTVQDSSAWDRIANWLLLIDVIRANPISGIGFDTLGYVGTNYGIAKEGGLAFALESDLLMILAMTGVVGLILYGRIFVRMLGDLKQLRQGSEVTADRALSVGLRAAFLAVVVDSFFTSLLLFPAVMGLLWILWALAERLRAELPQAVPAIAPGPIPMAGPRPLHAT